MANTKTAQQSLTLAMNKGPGALSERQAKSALDGALKKLTSAQRRLGTTQEKMQTAGKVTVSLLEITGCNALGSIARGYVGAEKIQLGGIDLRMASGLSLAALGLYDIAIGDGSWGEHAVNCGVGLGNSYLTEVMIGAGEKLAADRAPMVKSPAPAPAVRGEPNLVGATRQILLTPEPDIRGTPRRERVRDRRQNLVHARRFPSSEDLEEEMAA